MIRSTNNSKTYRHILALRNPSVPAAGTVVPSDSLIELAKVEENCHYNETTARLALYCHDADDKLEAYCRKANDKFANTETKLATLERKITKFNQESHARTSQMQDMKDRLVYVTNFVAEQYEQEKNI